MRNHAQKIVVVRACAVALTTFGLACPMPSRAEERPPRVFIDAGACPFECCTYREWFADRAVTLWDRPNGKRVVAHLRRDEPVDGLTGEVHSMPLRVAADADFPREGIKAGDVFYVLHYAGEGVWNIWRQGKPAELEIADETAPIATPTPKTWPLRVKSTCWVRVRTRHGIAGWTVSRGNFRNQDQCG